MPRDQAGTKTLDTLAPRVELSRFTHSANHSGAIGDDARHAVIKTEPPTRPMLPNEMTGSINGLVERWVTWRANNHGVPITEHQADA